MHRTIGFISKRFVNIRPGEAKKVFLTFAYFFFVITAYYVIKPVKRALILDDLGYRMVPYADLICVMLMGPIVTVFAKLVDRVSKPRLIDLSFCAVIAIMLCFWKLLAWPHPWLSGAFYIWVSIFSVLVVTIFWLVANDLYRPRDAKRLFGFIGSGGLLGGIVGSSIAAAGAQVVGTENLLLISTGFLVACWLIVRRLWPFLPEHELSEAETLSQPRRDTFLSDLGGFIRYISQSRYLIWLVAVVGINKIVTTFIGYQFNPFIEYTFSSLDAKTTFTSLFDGGINVLAFIVQFFFTSWILRRWGLLCALLILPIGVLAGTASLLLIPIFWVAAGTELYDRSLNYSLNNTAKEVLYLPIDRSIRYKIKPFIDMVVFRFGKGLAAVFGIILLNTLGMPVYYLSFLTVPLLVLWLVAVIKVRGEYTMKIRTLLQARANVESRSASAEGPEPSVSPGDVEPTLGSLTTDRPPERKLSLAARLVDGQSDLPHARELLDRLHLYEATTAKPQRSKAGFEISQVKRVIQAQTIPIAIRRQAIGVLGRRQDQDTLDYICGLMLVEREAPLAHEVARVLVKMRTAQPALQFPVPQIRRQVAREVATYESIIQVANAYRRHHDGPLTGDDPVIALLRVLMEESVEQIFRLLMLIYRPEDIHLVYEQLRVPDTYVRADAIELLDNLVDPAMRATIFPILDEDRFLSLLDEEVEISGEPATAYRIFQEAIWDHNSWLSITVLCAVGRLQLTTMHEELEKASRHTEPLVSSAAKVALHLATQS